MPQARFIPDEHGEESLRRLARGDTPARLPELWQVIGTLSLDLGLPEALRLTCGSPVKHALEPLGELAQWLQSGRGNLFSTVMGTAALSRSSHLYHRWQGAFEAVLILGERDSTIGVNRQDNRVQITVLETDDQPELEDRSVTLARTECLSLPGMLWDDLDGLLTLVGIELEGRERTRWERLRPDQIAITGG